jgi:hypothetical protein
VTLIPYKGPDAQAIIGHTQRPSRSEGRQSSISVPASVPPPAPDIPVSPAVSYLLLAAAAASAPPGMVNPISPINGISGTTFPPVIQPQQQQPANGHHLPVRRTSNGSLRSSVSQGSIPDSFAYGLGGGLPSMGTSTSTTFSTSSSWSDSTPTVSNQPTSRRNASLSLHPSGIQMSRSALEDIAEATSREEQSISQNVSRTNSIIPNSAHAIANIVITASTPLLGGNFEQQRSTDPITSGTSSPQGQTRSDTDPSGLPWLSREPSPTPSLPNLHKQSSVNSLANGLANLDLQGRNPNNTDEDASMSGGKTSTPPRIGNSGKRMLGHALGIRHPGLPPRVIAGPTTVSN